MRMQQLPSLSLAKSDAGTSAGRAEGLDGKSIALDGASTAVLTDEAASKDAILDAARRIVSDSAPGDNAVISFAGHGLQGADGRFYLGAVDDAGRPTSRAPRSPGTSWRKSLPPPRAASPCCSTPAIPARPGCWPATTRRSPAIRSAIPSGLTVLAASKGRELSAEMRELGGGVFTYALVAGDRGRPRATDVNGNGRIEVSELYRSVKDKVSALRYGQQTPWLSRNQMIGDFAIFEWAESVSGLD